jgi:phage-related protein
MNQIKVESKTLMLNLSSEVQIGPLKATLIAMVYSDEKVKDIDFSDIENITYNGVPISDWRKFRDMNKEFGIDYDKITEAEFNKIFTEEVVKNYIKGLK